MKYRFIIPLITASAILIAPAATTSQQNNKIDSFQQKKDLLRQKNNDLKESVKIKDTAIIKNLNEVQKEIKNLQVKTKSKTRYRVKKITDTLFFCRDSINTDTNYQWITADDYFNCMPDTVIKWYKAPNLFQRIFPKIFRYKKEDVTP